MRRRSRGGRSRPTSTTSSIRALARAREQVDKGQSALARATLDKAARELEREEAERQERFVASVTTLRTEERNYALAAYDGEAAAKAVVALGRALHGANASALAEFLRSEAQALYEHGRDRGSNVHLVAAIALRREQLALAASADETRRGAEQSRQCALGARRAGERDGAARGGGRRPIARRWRSGRASGFRSNGRRRRTISAMRSRRSASGRAGRRGSRRRSRPIARRWRNGRASGFRSTGR